MKNSATVPGPVCERPGAGLVERGAGVAEVGEVVDAALAPVEARVGNLARVEEGLGAVAVEQQVSAKAGMVRALRGGRDGRRGRQQPQGCAGWSSR